VWFHMRPLNTLEDCAPAYADLLDDVGSGRLTPDEAQTISAILRSARAVRLVELARDRLNSQFGAVVGTPPPSTDRRPVAIA
jgi:hypothetical protein